MDEILFKPPPVEVKVTQKFAHNLRLLSKKYRDVRKDLNSGVLEEVQKGNLLGEHIPCVSQEYAVYKARCKNTNAARGKRGGYRIVYCVSLLEGYENCIEVFLLTIYSKSDQEDISPKEIAEIIENYVLVSALAPISTLG